MAPAPAAAARPAAAEHKPFGLPVQSLQDLDAALAELGWLEAREERANADLKDTVAKAKRELEAKLIVVVGRDQVTFADRRTALEQSIAEFAAAHRDALLEDDRKSRDLNHGTFGWRLRPAGIEPRPGLTAAGDPGFLDRFVDAVRGLCAKLTGFLFDAAPYVKLQITLDKPGLLRAVKERRLTHHQLEKFGFLFRAPEDEFFCQPNRTNLHSHSAEQ